MPIRIAVAVVVGLLVVGGVAHAASLDPDGTLERWVVSRWPAWSPDGTTVAYQSDFAPDFPAESDIWAYRLADGSTAKLIADAAEPDWQPLVGPDCGAVTAHPPQLWPPSHHLRRVRLAAPADVTVGITRVTFTGRGGRRPAFVLLPGEPAVLLRAVRGRVYTISFAASDSTGACDGAVVVRVSRRGA